MKVYQTTAAYDTAISRWLAAQASDVADSSAKLEISLEKVDDLRYGENPQQKATVYRFAEGCGEHRELAVPARGLRADPGQAAQLQQLSGCRRRLEPGPRVRRACLRDPQASEPLRLRRRPEDITAAYDRAFACDPKSAFGGIIACNREVPMSWSSTSPIRTSSSSRLSSPRATLPRRSSAWPSAPTCACWLPAA